MSKYIYAKEIILEDSIVENGYLEITEENKFGDIFFEYPNHGEVLDYSNYILAPGLVDTHIHGYKSYDVMDNSIEGLNEISIGLLSCGVTSWLPTTLTDSIENLNAVCKTIGENSNKVSGAKIRGIFLEGPFFTEKHKGAQNPKYMGDPSIEKLSKWEDLSHDFIKKIAIAPERNGTIEFIKYATSKEIKVALAHSDASYIEAKNAVNAGASIFTHTYNGMSGLHHREPGMVGAALTLDDVYAEIISDGNHVNPVAIDVLLRSRGKNETVLITDCMRAGGLGDGMSTLGEFEVEVVNGAARLKSNQSLAGSVLELISAVKNIVKWNLASLEDAVRMATINPAKSVGINDVCGKIEKGLEADFIILDNQGNLLETFLNGNSCYKRGE